MSDIKLSIPKVGFDRFIHIDWLIAALRVRAETAELNDLINIIETADLGVEAKKKTYSVLKRLWFNPYPEFADFASRGVEIYKRYNQNYTVELSWGMAISMYPFFGKVAELVGRLSSLHGDCSAAEVHRRMSEVYGEREGTKRGTNLILQTHENWGVIKRVDGVKRVVPQRVREIDNPDLICWLLEGALHYFKKPILVSSLYTQPVLFPFIFSQSMIYACTKSQNLIIRSDGPSSQLICLKESI